MRGLRWRIARAVARRVAQGGPRKGRVYFFDTIVASNRSLRECRGLVTEIVLLALDEYRDELDARFTKSIRRIR